MTAICKLCRKEPASVKVTYGSYQSHHVQTLTLCLPCSHKLWKGNKICSLGRLVTAGIVYYTIEGLC